MKAFVVSLLATLPTWAMATDNFVCQAYCIQTEQRQSITQNRIVTLVAKEGQNAYQALGNSPENAFRNLAQICRDQGGTKLLSSYDKESVYRPDLLSGYSRLRRQIIPPIVEFLEPALVNAVAATISESCRMQVKQPARIEDTIVDRNGTIVLPGTPEATR